MWYLNCQFAIIIKIALKGLGSLSFITWIEVHEHKPELVLSCQNWQGNI